MIYPENYVKGKRFTQEFELNDARDQVIPKVGPGSVIGEAIASTAVVPYATNVIAGKVMLAVEADYKSTRDDVATTPAYVNRAVSAIPRAADNTYGLVALNCGTRMPQDATNGGDALTAAGFNSMATAATLNPIQQAIVTAFGNAIGANQSAQNIIASILVDEVVAVMAAATDTFQGKVALNLGTASGDDTNNVDALTAAGLNVMLANPSSAINTALYGSIKVATDTVQGKVALNLGTASGDDRNSVDALTAAGLNTILASPSSALSQTIYSSTPQATDTVQGKVSLAVAANYPSTSDVEATTPAYVGNAIQIASAANGKVQAGANITITGLGSTTSPYIVSAPLAINTTFAPTVSSGNTIGTYTNESGVVATVKETTTVLAPTVSNGHAIGTYSNEAGTSVALKETITTLGIANNRYVYTDEAGAQTAIDAGNFISPNAGNSLGADSFGRLYLNVPAQFPDDQVMSGDPTGTVAVALTPATDPVTSNVNYTLKSDLKVAAVTPTNETNPLAWSSSGFYINTATIAANIAASSTANTSIVAAFPVATDTVQGKVSLAVASNFPSTSDAEATTPAYLAAAVGTLVPTATDTVQGKVSLAVAANYPSTSNSEAVTPAYLTAAVNAAIAAAIAGTKEALYPIGSIYNNATDATNPATLLGFGTWTAFAQGRMPVGFNAADPLFDTAEETGGSPHAVLVSHSHSASDSGHSHGYENMTGADGRFLQGGGQGSNGATSHVTSSAQANISVSTEGQSGTNANLPPYITVYMWKRTA